MDRTEQRLDALEQNRSMPPPVLPMPGGVSAAASSASSVRADSSRGGLPPDPLQGPGDPWLAARQGSGAWSGAAGNPKGFGKGREEVGFVARRFFLRGFCPYQKEESHGIKTAVLFEFWRKIVPHLPPDLAAFVVPGDEGLSAPRYLNKELAILVHDDAPIDAARILSIKCTDIARRLGLTLNSCSVYFTADAPLVVKKRRWLLKSAEVALLPYVPAGACLKLDWVKGLLYFEPAGHGNRAGFLLGQVLGASAEELSWSWQEARMHELFPALRLDALLS
jgi:hypothetical protein